MFSANDIASRWNSAVDFFATKFDAVSTKIDAMENPAAAIDYQYTESVNLRGIIGLPPRFSRYADLPVIKLGDNGTETYLSTEGRKYLETYIKFGSFLYLEIGRPNLLQGLKDGLVEAVVTMGNGQMDPDVVSETASVDKLKSNGIPEMVTFRAAGYEYGRQVKVLVDAVATFLNLHNIYTAEEMKEYGLSGSGEDIKYRTGHKNGYFDFSNYIDDVHALGVNDADSNDKGYSAHTLCIYTNGAIETPFTLSHELGESQLLSQVTGNAMNNQISEIMFLDPKYDPKTSTKIGDNYWNNATFFEKFLISAFKTLPLGVKMVAPEVWKGTQFSKSVDIPIILQAANPDPMCIFKHVLGPLMEIIAVAFPTYFDKVAATMANKMGAYGPPFVVRGYSKGAVSINLGIIESISIIKNAKDNSVEGFPTRIEVTITIKDLYGVIGLPQTPANKYNVLNAMGLTEFLAGMTGVTLSQEQIKRTYLEAAAVGKGMYIINTPVRLVKRIENSIMVGASNLYKKGIDKIWNMMVVD